MKEWSTMKKLIWLRRYGGGSSDPLVTLTGKIISFFSKAAKPFKSTQIAIEPVQDLHGYEAPWPPGGGKNKGQFTSEYDRGSSYAQSIQRTYTDGILSISGTVDTANVWVYNQDITSIIAGLGAATFSIKIFSGDVTNLDFRVNVEEAGQATERYSFSTTETTLVYNSSKTYKLVVFIAYDAIVGGSVNLTAGIQIEDGSTKTEWQPYENISPISGWTGANIYDEAEYDPDANPKVTVNFGQTVYGGQLTVNEDGSGHIVASMAELDLGTRSWSKSGVRFYTPWSTEQIDKPYANPDEGQNYIANAVCTQYEVTKRSAIEREDFAFSIHIANATYLTVVDSRYTDAAAFQTAMSGVKLVYELAEPVTIPLTPGQIQTLVGVNTVWADTNGDLTVEVYGTPIT